MLWDRATDEVAQGDGGQPRRAQPDLHDGQLGSARIVQADPPARRDARPDGEPEGRDHRAPDQVQLHGGPVGARVLHLHPRRPQGPRRHGAAHRRLGLSDPAPGRRLPGRDHPRRRLQDQGLRRDAAARRRGQAEPEPGRPDRGEEVRDQARPRAAQARPGDRPARARADRRGVRRRGGPGPGALGAQVRARERGLPGLLRPRARHRLDGRARRRGRDHRRAVDRRARHAADDAHLPHRRRRRARHHPGPAPRGRAVRGAQAEGHGRDGRGRRQGRDRGDRQGDPAHDHRRQGRGAPRTSSRPGPGCWSSTARRSRPARSSRRGRCTPPTCCGSAAGRRSSSTSSRRSRRSTRRRASTSTTSTSS